MFCSKCGTNIPENDNFCPTCGEPVNKSRPVFDEHDHTAMFEAEDIERTRILSIFCYVSTLFIIVGLLAEPNSRFLRYHINQVFNLYIFALICAAIAVVPVIGWIVGGIGSIAVLVFMIIGLFRASKGLAKDLPLVSRYTIIHYD